MEEVDGSGSGDKRLHPPRVNGPNNAEEIAFGQNLAPKNPRMTNMFPRPERKKGLYWRQPKWGRPAEPV